MNIKSSNESSKDTPSYLRDLNPEQLEAALYIDGPILVLAGAGSGKTRVLTRRIVHLIQGHGVRPIRILAVTFTNKAANEMRERLHTMLGADSNELWISTFHSTAVKILRRYANRLGYSNDFVIYDDQDSNSLMKGVLNDLGMDPKQRTPSEFLSAIDRAKNKFILPDGYEKELGSAGASRNYKISQVGEVYRKYQQALMLANAMDFGDLLVNALRLFREHPDVLEYYQHRFQYVLVDEFQDTNYVQYELISAIVKKHSNLFVVGDDDQSIYAFRGATISNILEFEKQFPKAKVVTLDQNYRSTGNILSAANSVISANINRRKKVLWTQAGAGPKLVADLLYNEDEEASYVVDEIREQLKKGRRPSEMAVFYRTNSQSRALEEALVSAGIPYRIFGGLRFYERREIKDLLAYIRVFVNPRDIQAFLRIVNTPARGIGAQGVKSILDFANKNACAPLEAVTQMAQVSKRDGPVTKFAALIKEFQAKFETLSLAEFLERLLDATNYITKLKESLDPQVESRLENISELVGLIKSMEKPVNEVFPSAREVAGQLLERVALTGAADQARDESGAPLASAIETVSLLTLHLAKGLEFPIVFFTGLEAGLIPHSRSYDEPGGIDEERRLCYVGITRAMQEIYITRASVRIQTQHGGGFGAPSPFMRDIPKDLLTSKRSDYFEGDFFGTGRADNGVGESVNEVAPEPEIAQAPERVFIRRRQGDTSKVERTKSWKISVADDL